MSRGGGGGGGEKKKRIDSFSASFSSRDQGVFKQPPLIAIPGARSQASLKKYGSHGRVSGYQRTGNFKSYLGRGGDRTGQNCV